MKIIIKGVAPYDGEYDFALDKIKNRDVEIIKRVSGYTPLEYPEAGKRGDTTFLVALGICAARRGGLTVVDEDVFWEAELGAVTLDVTDEEADLDPPQTAPETPTTPSGAHSRPDGEQTQVRSLPNTGTGS